jgi:hypothetical protein
MSDKVTLSWCFEYYERTSTHVINTHSLRVPSLMRCSMYECMDMSTQQNELTLYYAMQSTKWCRHFSYKISRIIGFVANSVASAESSRWWSKNSVGVDGLRRLSFTQRNPRSKTGTGGTQGSGMTQRSSTDSWPDENNLEKHSQDWEKWITVAKRKSQKGLKMWFILGLFNPKSHQ